MIIFVSEAQKNLDPLIIATHYMVMTKKRIFTIIGSFFLVAVLIYGLTSISVSEETENTSAWTVRCNEDDKGNKAYCEMVNSLFVKDTGALLTEFAIGYPENAEGEARAVVLLPLEMMLKPGGVLQVDDGESYSFTMRNCSVKGCYALIDLKDEIITQLKGGKKLNVMFVLGDKRLALGIPLDGFSSTFKTLK